MINEIKEKYKTKDQKEIIIAYGDWSIGKQLRGFMPTKGIGLKRTLSKYFRIINIDEYNTSKMCHYCGKETEKFMKRKNPKPYKDNEIIVHGLLRCKNVICNKYFERDFNGAFNIRKICISYLKNKAKPTYLKRVKKKEKPKEDFSRIIKSLTQSLIKKRKLV